MADSRKETRIIEYQLQGNTVGLEQALSNAIHTIDALDQKLTEIAASARTIGSKDATNFKRASTISAAETRLSRIRAQLDVGSQGPAAVSPDQLNTINLMNKELTDIYDKLNKAKDASRVTQKTLDKTKSSLGHVNYALRESNVKLKESSKSVAEIWSTVMRIVHIVRYLLKLYQYAGNFVETINLFNVAVKGSKENLTDLAQRMADAYNTDIQPIYNSIAVFRQYANTLYFAKDAADTFSDGLTKLTYDLASLYNVEYETMAKALKSGMAGQTKSLMQYGISVHQATLEQTALQLGITKSASAWSTADKVAIRYLTVLEQTKNAQGDLARTLESPVNQFKILKAQLQVLLRNGGSFVILIAQKILPLINGLIIAFNKFLEVMAKAAGYTIEDYSDNLSPTNEMLGEIEEGAEDASESMKHLLAPLDEINQATNNGSGDGIGLGLDPEIEAALRTYDNLMDQIYTKTDRLGEMFESIFGSELAQGIGRVLSVVFETLGKVIDTASVAISGLAPILNVVLTIVGELLTAVSWMLSNIVNPVLNFVGTLLSNIWLLIGAFAVLNLWQLAITGSFEKMIAVQIIKWFASLGVRIYENIKLMVQYTAQLVKNIAIQIKNCIQTALATHSYWQLAIAATAAAGAAALIVAGIVAAAAATTAAQARAATAQDYTPGRAAKGGVATKPTLTWIGEGKYEEAVVPLGRSPQFTTMKEDIADSVYGKVSQTPNSQYGQPRRDSQSATVILQVNGRELARALLPDIGITRPQTGVKLT